MTTMGLDMLLRVTLLLGILLQCSSVPSQPLRVRRHVDGMFTSEFSRARGSAAIRKLVNSVLGGKSFTKERRQESDLDTPEGNARDHVQVQPQETDLGTAERSVLDPVRSWNQENVLDTAERSVLDPVRSWNGENDLNTTESVLNPMKLRHQDKEMGVDQSRLDSITPIPEFSPLLSMDPNSGRAREADSGFREALDSPHWHRTMRNQPEDANREWVLEGFADLRPGVSCLRALGLSEAQLCPALRQLLERE